MFRTGLGSAHDHRETVVDAQGIQPVHMKSIRIGGSDAGEHASRLVIRRVFQNRGQRGTGVFGVEIDFVVEQSPVRKQRSAQVEAAIYFLMQPILKMLRDDLAQYNLFGEVLRTYADRGALGGARRER